ncbi:MAG TPA: quinone oxidoreductase [Acidisarcina sp.]
MKAIEITTTGDPDVLRFAELRAPVAGPGSALVRVHAAGVNFIDVYHREGRYKAALPFVPGMEGAGTIEALGTGAAEGFCVGDRVAWCGVMGSYAELAVVPLEKLIAVPEGVGLKDAAAVMLQGMTAHYLTRSTYALKAGDTALVHAAAGGVGLLLTQMASQLGARVIATVSTEEKAALVLEAGASDVILYTECDFEVETKHLTAGRGVDVVYDSVGKTTFDKSLNCLRPRGLLVLFGGSSGAVPPFDLIQLSAKGSLFITRPSLQHYTQTREELVERAEDVLGCVQAGKLKVRIGHTYPLANAAQAHRDLEGRKTTGKILLLMD